METKANSNYQYGQHLSQMEADIEAGMAANKKKREMEAEWEKKERGCTNCGACEKVKPIDSQGSQA